MIRLTKVAVSQIPEDLMIPELGSVVIDDRTCVFGFFGKKNGRECGVIKWDEDLRFLKRFSRQGMGPGEISMMGQGATNRLFIDSTSGDLVIVDYNPTRLVVYDQDGQYKKDINLTQKNAVCESYHQFHGQGDGQYLAFKSVINTESSQLVRFSVDPFAEENLWNLNDSPIYIGSNSGIFFSDFFGSRSVSDSDSGMLIVGNSQSFLFRVFNRLGEQKLEIAEPNRQMGFFSEQELESIKNHSFSSRFMSVLKQDGSFFTELFKRIKRNKNPVRDIRIGGDRIYIFMLNDDICQDNRIPTAVYDMAGRHFKTVYFEKIPDKIRGQFVFYLENDEEDNSVLVKYRLPDDL